MASAAGNHDSASRAWKRASWILFFLFLASGLLAAIYLRLPLATAQAGSLVVTAALLGTLCAVIVRTRFQFRLRTLLLLTLLASLACSAGVWWWKANSRQARAVAHFRQIGADIYFDFQWGASRHRENRGENQGWIYTSQGYLVPTWLCRLMGEPTFGSVRDIWVTGTLVRNEDLLPLKDLPQLRSLHIANSSVNDEGLVHLRGLPELKSLELYGTLVQGPGLKELQALPKLEILFVTDANLTDDDLEYLSGLRLQALGLERTRVTDAGIAQLRAIMPHLRFIRLAGTQFTDAALDELERFEYLELVSIRGTSATPERIDALERKLEHRRDTQFR